MYTHIKKPKNIKKHMHTPIKQYQSTVYSLVVH